MPDEAGLQATARVAQMAQGLTTDDLVLCLISDVPGDAPEVIPSGPTVADSSTCADAAAMLDRHDAYPFFEALGELVVPGPTFTNVNDFRALLVL